MKLLSLAICTASLTEIVVRPLLRTMCVDPDGICVVFAPSSLQRRTGSIVRVSKMLLQVVLDKRTVRLLPIQHSTNVLVERAEQHAPQRAINFTSTLLPQ
jgi:hypothetical protein